MDTELGRQLDAAAGQPLLDQMAPGHQYLDAIAADAAYTNQVQVLEALSPEGSRVRLVVKRLTDSRDPDRATAEYHALRIAREHGVPVPKPLFLDSTGEILGLPGIVTTFVPGRQISNPVDVSSWAAKFVRILLQIHTISLTVGERRSLYDGKEIGLYFLTDHWPETNSGHPLSEAIYDTVRELSPGIATTARSLLHVDFWPGNVLWHRGEIAALLDWDGAAVGDPALDVANFRMEMHLRGVKGAADLFLQSYEAEAGKVQHLGFWEIAAAARPLPNPAAWRIGPIKESDHDPIGEKSTRGYFEFVGKATARARREPG